MTNVDDSCGRHAILQTCHGIFDIFVHVILWCKRLVLNSFSEKAPSKAERWGGGRHRLSGDKISFDIGGSHSRTSLTAFTTRF